MATTLQAAVRTTTSVRLRSTTNAAGVNPSSNTTTTQVSVSYASTVSNSAVGGADTIYGPILKTLAASGTDTLDFNGGGLVDLLGGTIALARVKSVKVELLSASQTSPDGTAGTACSSVSVAGNLLVGANRMVTGTTPAVQVVNGGRMEISAGNAAGYTVTGGATDTITVTNNDGAVSAKYLITVIGGSS